jgi:hypothetical protein
VYLCSAQCLGDVTFKGVVKFVHAGSLVPLCAVKPKVNVPCSLLHAVIDLGAAPGAWTAYFAGHVARVAAVDPAEMGADAMLQNVTHIRKAVSWRSSN